MPLIGIPYDVWNALPVLLPRDCGYLPLPPLDGPFHNTSLYTPHLRVCTVRMEFNPPMMKIMRHLETVSSTIPHSCDIINIGVRNQTPLRLVMRSIVFRTRLRNINTANQYPSSTWVRGSSDTQISTSLCVNPHRQLSPESEGHEKVRGIHT